MDETIVASSIKKQLREKQMEQEEQLAKVNFNISNIVVVCYYQSMIDCWG